MVSALAIDGAATASTPRAAITYPNFFMSSCSIERIVQRIALNVPQEPEENSERMFTTKSGAAFGGVLCSTSAACEKPVPGASSRYKKSYWGEHCHDRPYQSPFAVR
jgi:hypothetical protein